MNNEGRGLYAKFIENVGRNIYPLIVATDHEPEFGGGVGSSFTLFLADGEFIIPRGTKRYKNLTIAI